MDETRSFIFLFEGNTSRETIWRIKWLLRYTTWLQTFSQENNEHKHGTTPTKVINNINDPED